MAVVVHHWDSFTRTPGKGNPAGIVLAADLSDDEMQSIAKATGFGDTAFVLPSREADLRLRYFSPRREVELCGHATIAAFATLHARGLLPPKAEAEAVYSLETKAGVLPIRVGKGDDGTPIVIMTQGRARFESFHGSREALAQAIGIAASDLHETLPILYGSTGRWTLVVPVKDLPAMQRMRPYPERFASLLADMPGASIHPFSLQTLDPRACAHARHFSSPSSGIVEDPVTGTASGVMGAYLLRFAPSFSAAPQPLVIEQGYEVGREGTVQVWVEGPSGDESVRIAGTASFVKDMAIG